MQGNVATAGRRRAAIELIAREEGELRRTARRYSLCAEDAEDAYQRALEIVLTKAPCEQPRELIRWTKTVVKHEALAIRRNRERLLGSPPPIRADETEAHDPIATIPTTGRGPDESLELREQVARSREALRTLKPAELRSLTLLAAGYSYAEIGQITGFSHTKVNRSLAEGRERFRSFLSRSEDGRRCAELRALLSAFCDDEASADDAATVREHLRACASCRATMRAYRTAPASAAALAPALPAPRSLLERAQELLAWVHSRLPGGEAADAGMAQVVAVGGTRGAGMAALAKALAICAGTVGGAAACVATGVVPPPLDLGSPSPREARVEPVSRPALEVPASQTVRDPAPPTPAEPSQSVAERVPEPEPVAPAPASPETGAIEYTAPAPEPTPSEPGAAPSGNPAGEFGP